MEVSRVKGKGGDISSPRVPLGEGTLYTPPDAHYFIELLAASRSVVSSIVYLTLFATIGDASTT